MENILKKIINNKKKNIENYKKKLTENYILNNIDKAINFIDFKSKLQKRSTDKKT